LTYTFRWVGRIGASAIVVGEAVSVMLSWYCCANPLPLIDTPLSRLNVTSSPVTAPNVAFPARVADPCSIVYRAFVFSVRFVGSYNHCFPDVSIVVGVASISSEERRYGSSW
jgi:hypothetical protein